MISIDLCVRINGNLMISNDLCVRINGNLMISNDLCVRINGSLMISPLMVSSKIVKGSQQRCSGSSIESFTGSSPSEQL